MKPKRIIYERFIFCVLLIAIWFFTANRVRTKNMFHSSLAGIVNEIVYNDRVKSYVQLKFYNTPETNVLTEIQDLRFITDKNLLLKGDSIYKPMFTEDYYVYRKNENNEYLFLYKLTSSIKK